MHKKYFKENVAIVKRVYAMVSIKNILTAVPIAVESQPGLFMCQRWELTLESNEHNFLHFLNQPKNYTQLCYCSPGFESLSELRVSSFSSLSHSFQIFTKSVCTISHGLQL